MVSLSGPQLWINFSHSVAGSATQFSPPNDPFAVPLSAFETDMTVNTTSVFVAAQQAVTGFKELPAEVSKTFFFTDNNLNVEIIPGFATQGAGKSASAHLIEAAAAAYKEVGTSMFAIMIVVAKEYANV